MRSGLFLFVFATLLVGCGHVKEFAPIRYNPIYPRMPNQQRLMSQSTLQAIEKAAAGMNLAQYAGKRVRVEVNGVFPHSQHDLLDYVATAVEGEAARAGAHVIERPDPDLVPDSININYSPSAAAPASPPPPPPTELVEKPDVRLVASVDWGGIDLKDHKYVKGAQIAASVLLSITLFGIPAVLIWNSFSPPYGHTFTMIGRARITLRAIPLTPGLAAAASTGEGESSIVVDTESDTGYTLIMPLPKEAGAPSQGHVN